MQQNASNCVLPAAPIPPPSHDPAVGVNRSKFNFFQKVVMLYDKLNGITNEATW